MKHNNNEIPAGYKNSALGVIPLTWEVKRLGEICNFKSGGTPSKDNKSFWIGNIPWISASTMHELKIYDSELKISDDGLKSGSNLAEKGSLLLLVRGSMLWNRIPICVCMTDVAFNQDVKCLNVIEKYTTNEFIFYWILANENILLHSVVGTGIGAGKLDSNDLKHFNVCLPPLEEQKRIAEVLGLWDRGIELQSELVDRLTKRKRALMQQLLTARKRLPNFTASWQTTKLGNIAKITKGKALSSKDITEGEYSVIAGGKTSPYTHCSFTDENCITISASGAYAGYVAYHNYRIWASDCSVVYSNDKRSDVRYLYYLLSFHQEFIYSLQSGGAQPHIFPKDIAGIKYKLPSLDEQKAIAEVLMCADREIEIATKKIASLRNQKRGLMQQLLTGKKQLKIK